MILLAPRETLQVEDIPPEIHPSGQETEADGFTPGMSLADAERLVIARTLEMTGGNRQQAAKMLGIGERTLYRKIKDYGLGH